MPAAKPTAVELELLELELLELLLLLEELLKLTSSMSIQSFGEGDVSCSVAPSTSIAAELELLELLQHGFFSAEHLEAIIAAAADVYHDMPFAQCVHDGGTIQKQKYEAVGLQFIGARYNLLTDLQCNGLASDAPVC
jgi:hypothetical protein